MSATMSPALPPNLIYLTGPILLGSMLNWWLYGILGLQTYLYFIRYPNDRKSQKWLVAVVFFLDSVQTVFATHAAWAYLARGWGDVVVLQVTPWSFSVVDILSGIVSAIVQIFFAWRIWSFIRSIILCSMIVAIALMQCISVTVGAIQFWMFDFSASSLSAIFPAFTIWLVGSLACDILIAFIMVYFLLRAKSQVAVERTANIITRLIGHSVQTGAVTAVCAAVELILFLKFKENNLHLVPFFMLGKLYPNTLLATLNARSLDVRGEITQLSTSATWRNRGNVSTSHVRGLSVQIDTTRELDPGMKTPLEQDVEGYKHRGKDSFSIA